MMSKQVSKQSEQVVVVIVDGLNNSIWMSGHWAQLPEAGSSAEMATYQNAVELQNSRQQDSLTTFTTSNNPPSVPPQRCMAPHYPAHFTKGSIIHLASGELKRIEDLLTEDFVRSADISKDLCLDTSVVCGITPVADRDTVMLEFSVGQSQVQARCWSQYTTFDSENECLFLSIVI